MATLTKPKLKARGGKLLLKATSPAKRLAKSHGKGDGVGLMVMVPSETMKELRIKAASTETTVRALVLDAIDKAGYNVPAGDLIDRRRR